MNVRSASKAERDGTLASNGADVRYISTRGEAPTLGFVDAMLAGLGRDGGLYVPAVWPGLDADAIYRDIVSYSGLEHFIDVPIKNYSSGMYMRLGFAIAGHLEADITYRPIGMPPDERFASRTPTGAARKGNGERNGRPLRRRRRGRSTHAPVGGSAPGRRAPLMPQGDPPTAFSREKPK